MALQKGKVGAVFRLVTRACSDGRRHEMTARDRNSANRAAWAWTAGLIALAVLAPFFVYPVFVMKALCMALFAGPASASVSTATNAEIGRAP